MVLNVHRDWEKEEGGCVCVWGGGVLYTYRYSHHQNDCCTKMGSDESHFSVSLIVRDSPQTTAFEEKGLEEQSHNF